MFPALSLQRRATQDLHFIRRTMERATAFTAVPGWGLVAMGATALVAAGVASFATDPLRWLVTWTIAAVVGSMTGVVTMVKKARGAGLTILSGPGRRFLVALLPPLAAGALLTLVVARLGRFDLLPGLWLLLYGVSVLTGGAFAIRPVVLMGGVFFLFGAATFFLPERFGDPMMAAGFGGLHLVFGLIIARRYGG